MTMFCMRCNKNKVEARSSMREYHNICMNCGLQVAISKSKYFEFKCDITPDWNNDDYMICARSDKLVKEGKMTYRTVKV